MNEKSCIICGSKNIKKYNAEFMPFLKERMFHFQDDETDMIYCPECNFYYSSNRPDDEKMDRFYTGYRDETYQKQREKYEPFYTKEFNHDLGFSKDSLEFRKKILSDIIQKYVPQDSISNILDYGGDSGQYIPDIFNSKHRYVYEISDVNPIEGVTRIDNFEDLKDINWDLIMCCHVLEHVSDPKKILDQIFTSLPVNGYLYIEVPYEDYVDPFINTNAVIPIHEHINLFRCETFSKIFEDCHFEILDIQTVNVPSVDGQVFGKHIQCLVKKVVPTEMSILINKNSELKLEKQKLNIEISKLERKIDEQNATLKTLEARFVEQTNLIHSLAINIDEQRFLTRNIDELCFVIKNNLQEYIGRPTFYQQIFSIKNEGKHKVLRLLGIKFKFKRRG